jgi:hypothetical protein
MAAVVGSSLSGVEEDGTEPDSPIMAAQMENIAKDHGYAYELLLNKNGDGGGGAPTSSGHRHDTTGNLLYWPLTTACFGPEMPDSGGTFYQEPPQIFSASPSPAQGLVLFLWPFFVPVGMAGKRLLIVLEAYGDGDPATFATLSTWGTTSPPSTAIYTTETAVSGNERVPFRRYGGPAFDVTDGTLFVAEVTPAAAGIHTVKVFRDIPNATVQQPMFYRALHAYWDVSMAGVNMNTVPTVAETRAAGGNAAVGDIHNSNAYVPVDSTLVAADAPMGVSVMLNQANSAWLEEMATGLPAGAGAALALAKGHDHSNSGSSPYYGRGLEFNLYSEPYGTADANTNGLVLGTNVINGRFYAPKVPAATTTATVTRYITVYTPVDAGSSTLYMCAVVHNNDPSKASAIEVTVTPYPNGVAGTARTVTGTTGGAGGARYEVLTHASTLATQSGGYTRFEVAIRMTSNTGNTGYLMGLALFFDR